MDRHALEEALSETAEDWLLTRRERADLKTLLRQAQPSDHDLAYLRNAAFKIAHAKLPPGEARDVLHWLEGTIKTLLPQGVPQLPLAEAHFSPGEACRRRIRECLDGSYGDLDICVFTITDDHISDAILRAHRRGVTVRVITDNDKSEDLGSDIVRLEEAGIQVRVDQTDDHMHHKFVVVDRKTLVTGSYNWTRSAFLSNQENIAVTGDARLVAAFRREFERLWERFGS